MRLIWLADYTVKDYLGGAQITNLEMIKFGEKLGYKIIQVNHQEFPGFRFRKTDRVILNNMAVLNRDHHDKLMWVILNLKFVRYIHDYDWVYNDMHVSTISGMFKRSSGVVFLSPLQKAITMDKGFKISHSTVIPSPIDTEQFFDQKIERKKGSVIYAGEINTHKGINHIYNYALFHPELKIDLYSLVSHPGLVTMLPPNVELMSKKPNQNMAHIYNQYEKFIHLPVWREPFGRAVAEAYLCGCEIISNGRIGFESFDWDYKKPESVKAIIKKAPKEFWKYIEKRLL